MLTRRQKFLVIGWIIAVAVMRLTLIPRGHFFMQDELRYRYSLAFLRELAVGNLKGAGQQLYQRHLQLRPGLVLINLPTAGIQAVVWKITGLKTETPLSLSIPAAVNVAIAAVVTYLIFSLGFRWVDNFNLSFSAMVVYSLLVNSNLYLRHILPYNFTLMTYLMLLKVLVRKRQKLAPWQWAALGSIIAFVYSVYPGFYAFPVILTLTGWWLWPRSKRWSYLKWWITGGGITYGIIILMGAIISGRFLTQAWQYASEGQTAGEFQETGMFLYRYLVEVERLVGVILVILLAGFLITSWKLKLKRETRVVMSAVIGLYLFHTAVAMSLHKLVFYGRTLHMYFPFVVLAAILWIKSWSKKWQTIGTGILILTVIISWTKWYPRFLNLQYPGDVLYAFCQEECQYQVAEENENYQPDSIQNHLVKNPIYLAINFGRYFFPEPQKYNYDTQGGELIFQSSHPINFVAYQFEALTSKERQLIQERNYQMKLYQLP